ncbi:MAG: TonB family protein [Puniceicoccales bacterium]|jgi:protein TonB|nr:TonB family protein [Puniceicoccales bacterium]
MRIDLILGILLAAAIHAGVAFADKLFPPSAAPVAIAEDAAPPTIAINAPPLEPEPDDTVPPPDAIQEQAPDLTDLAPPMQADTPTPVITPTAFIQRLQPPPPNLGNPVAAVTIPKGNFAATGNKNIAAMFDLASLDQKPVPTFHVNPVYPYEMRRARISGQVVIGFIVDNHGNVLNPYVIRSTNATFEPDALRAIVKWRFKPGRKSGRDVTTRNVQQLFNFKLN